jgi:rubrerythrin
MNDNRILKIIDSAIVREEEAYWFYTDIYEKVSDPAVKETLTWIAEEEKKHRAFLVAYRSGSKNADTLRMTDPVYYTIAEYISEPDVSENMSGADVYLVASHREKRSHQFYWELANLHPEGETRELFKKMAQEELHHKEKMEYLYTNTAFPQTAGG